jgi:hypothetical protein
MLAKLYMTLRIDWDDLLEVRDGLHDLWREQWDEDPTAWGTMMLLGAWWATSTLADECTSPQEFMKKARRAFLQETDLGRVDPVTGELLEYKNNDEKEG